MKKRKIYQIKYLMFAILFIGIALNASSQTTMDCVVKIKSPAFDGESVQIDGAVSGVAKIPDGGYLWTLVHRVLPFKQQGVWWPQTNSEVSSDSTWNCWITYGQDKDVGFEFEIAVIIVDRTEHLKLQAYIQKGDWSQSIKMPKTLCPPVFRKVKKTN